MSAAILCAAMVQAALGSFEQEEVTREQVTEAILDCEGVERIDQRITGSKGE